MPKFTIKTVEVFNDETQEFTIPEEHVVHLEHSLVSLSAWESKWEIPFLSDKKKTTEQTLDYVRIMCLDEDVDPEVFERLDNDSIEKIEKYISSKQTATWFNNLSEKKKNSSETITAELIYYWMVALQIPFECQYWHINKLMTLIQVCDAKNQPDKKMNKKEVMERNRKLNEQRKAKLNTSG